MGVLENLVAGAASVLDEKPMTGLGQSGLAVENANNLMNGGMNLNEGFNTSLEFDDSSINASIAKKFAEKRASNSMGGGIMENYMNTIPNPNANSGGNFYSGILNNQPVQSTGVITINANDLDRLVEQKVRQILGNKHQLNETIQLPTIAKLELTEKNKPKTFNFVIGNSLYTAELKFVKKLDK